MPINIERHSEQNPLIIAGPCAAESPAQLEMMASALVGLGIEAMRASDFKPRSKPGWSGVGYEVGGEWFADIAERHHLAVATEVTSGDDVDTLIRKMTRTPGRKQLIVWLGSRMQLHTLQQDVGRALKDAPESTLLVIKNQPWGNQGHWEGIVDHVAAGAQMSESEMKRRVVLCHRGFEPYNTPNPQGFRNMPDFAMAMRMKEKLGMKMILDPSHIGGTQSNVMNIVRQAIQDPNVHFDGFMIEVHPDPQAALTDAKQQLSVPQFTQLLEDLDNVRA